MIRRVAIAFAIALSTSGPASADSVPVRSGRHEDFTRLVFAFEAPANWRIVSSADGYVLNAGAGHDFDFSSVFERIGHSRLDAISVSQPGGAVRLRLGCDCYAVAASYGDTWVVVDIREHPSETAPPPEPVTTSPEGSTTAVPPASRRENAAHAQPAAAQPEAAPMRISTHRNAPSTTEPSASSPPETERTDESASPTHIAPSEAILFPLLALRPSIAAPGSALPAADSRRTATTSGSPTPDEPDPMAQALRVFEARSALLEQIGRAASEGLLTANIRELPDMPLHPARPVQAPPEDATPDAGAPDRAQAPAEPEPDNVMTPPLLSADTPDIHMTLRAATVFERDRPDTSAVTSPGPACLDPALVDVAAWGDGTDDPAGQLARARSALLGEFDTPRPGAALSLAKLYIHLGFGAEARAILASFAVAEPEAAVLAALAQIMETGNADKTGPLREQTRCPGAVAFWAVMARPTLSEGTPIRAPEIQGYFSSLPPALRRHLGPEMAQRLLDAGHGEAAYLIRSAIERAGGPQDSEVALMSARLDFAGGRVDAARATLMRIIAANDPVTPTALIELVDLLVASGGQASEQLVRTAAALAFEYRHTPSGPALKRAQLLATALTGDYRAAFDALADAEDGVFPPRPEARTLTELLDTLIAGASDAELVEIFFQHRSRIKRAGTGRAQYRALARRLVNAGLAGTALELLTRQEAPPALEDRMLRAEALLAMDEPGAALAELQYVSDDNADALRAQALEMSGAYTAALAVADPASHDALAWRAGDWQAVLREGTQTQRDALELTRATADAQPPTADAPTPEVAQTEPSLSTGRKLLEESAAARQALRALLTTYDIPEPLEDSISDGAGAGG